MEVRALPPEPVSDVDPAAAPPPITPQRNANRGCIWIILLTPVVVILGLLIGAILRDDDGGGDETAVRLDEGEIAGVPWYVDAVRDVDGDSCVFLYEDGEQLTGSCTTEPQDATIADTATVVFGIAPRESTAVRVGLSNGETIEIETEEAPPVSGRFYVDVVEEEGDLDVTGELDAVEE